MSPSLKVSLGSLFSFAVLFYAYYYKNSADDILTERLEKTLHGLLRAERKVSVDPRTKIAIGFGSCHDLIVPTSDVLLSETPPEDPQHFDVINNKEELLRVFSYFFRHGAASERFVSNVSLFEDIASVAKSASSARFYIGGNAPIMANRFALEGCDVLLGAQMSTSLMKYLPDNVEVSGPIVEEDDVHILLEYPAGQVWGKYISPRANRFIIHNDHQNPLLSAIENFGPMLKKFNPNILILGGLQMMDNFPFPQGVREARLQEVQRIMVNTPSSIPIHFEMASYTDQTLLQDLVDNIIPFADSLGMNEQELPNLFHILMYGNISYVSNSYPRVATVLDGMRDIYRLLQRTAGQDNKRQLTRLHVHTLAFQAILTKKNSIWKNSMSSAAKAALTAHRHTCGSHEIDTTKAKLIMDDSFTTTIKSNAKRIFFKATRPVSCWDEEDFELCVAPVLVCTKVIQTGGGGDNVSAAGLVLQV